MIPEIRKILYATDLSKNSAYAFYYAVDMAKKYDAKIIILHAVEPIPPYARFYTSLMEKVEEEQRKTYIEEIEKRLVNFCRTVEGEGVTSCVALVSKILVRMGYPAEEILQTAEDEGCDLIFLGNHGKGFLKQTFLGSVSRAVLDRSRKAVFIIPLPSEKAAMDLQDI
jgi:nucleotide-binding universal stress UspA family protein